MPGKGPWLTSESLQPWRERLWLAPLLVGVLALAIPTIQGIALVSWSTEQGAHGPIVLAIGIWLVARAWPQMTARAMPGEERIGWPALAVALVGYLVAHVVGSIVLESLMMYCALLATLYLFVGWRAIRHSWFPLFYLLFVLPPPGSWVAVTTQPLRLEISQRAVDLLAFFGYSVARSGLLIYVDQYILEVKAACGGLNSIISLSAIGLFYAYIKYRAHVSYLMLLLVVIIAMAVFANFTRVIVLVLITHYLGDNAAQGFLHELAGLTMFTVAMGGMLLFDRFAGPVRRRMMSAASA